jgi:cytochrome b
MAPFFRPAVRRFTGSIDTAATAAQHMMLIVLTEVVATVAHAPIGARVVIALACLVGHWRIHRRRH